MFFIDNALIFVLSIKTHLKNKINYLLCFVFFYLFIRQKYTLHVLICNIILCAVVQNITAYTIKNL